MSDFKLRPYQQQAVEKALATVAKRPLIVLPTGAGKSLVCAELAKNRSFLFIQINKSLSLKILDRKWDLVIICSPFRIAVHRSKVLLIR